MSGILFPNLVGTLAPLIQMDQAAEQNAFQRDRIRRADQLDAEDRETGKLFGPALQGDKDAQARLMSSRHAPTLLQHLERVEVGKRAKAKEDADYITGNGMAILNAPADQQPGLYARVRQEAAASGRDVSTWPTTYNPSWVKFNVDKAMSVKDHFDRQNSGPQAMPPPGGGGAAPGGFTGQVARDESGGNYNIPNAKGSGAYGKYQFMPDTWATVAQANPQLNLPMNMRQATPQQQEAAMEAFTRSNGQALVQAGQPATPANLYLAHRFGTQGATKFLSTPDNTPIAQVFPANWIQQNPDLNTTVGQFKRSVQSRYGGMPVGREVDIATNAAPMPEPPPGMAVFSTPAQMPGGPSGAPPGMAVGDTRPQADASGNPLPPPAHAPGAAFGQEFDAIREKLRAGGVDIFEDRKTRQAEVQNGNFVIRSLKDGRIVGYQPVKPAKEPGSGPFAGTGMDQQAMNVLLTGDPASPEYALSYSHLSKARTTLDEQGRPVTIQPMDLSAVRKPAGLAAAPAATGGGTTTAIPGGGTVTVGDSVAPKGPGQAEMAKLRTARAEAEQITSAANDFKKEWEKATPLERARSLTGANTPLNAAYNNFALLAKGDALFKLGVLNGPDLEIIRRTIPDPSTGKSIMTTQGDVTSSVDKVLSILNAGITATEKQLNIGQPAPAAAGTQEAPAKAAKGTYMGPDNKPISWPEIEATAKNRGISIDEVIGRLGLQPTGMQ